jgi:hypothetical protein
MKLLTEIGLKYGTDKAEPHYFTDFYDDKFNSIRFEPLRILELGVAHGASIRMWLEYFPNAHITGVDIVEHPFEHERFTYIKEPHYKFALQNKSFFDIIIDDGSHITSEQVDLYDVLYSTALARNGFYVCEDLHTSFMSEYIIRDVNAYNFFKDNGFETYEKIDPFVDVLCITSIKQKKSE